MPSANNHRMGLPVSPSPASLIILIGIFDWKEFEDETVKRYASKDRYQQSQLSTG